MIRSLLIIAAVMLLQAAPVRADFNYPPLVPLPSTTIHELGPLLRGSDLVLVESDDSGGLRQTTTISLVAAAPEVVRDALIHAERYSEFVRNMPRSTVQQNPDGTFDHHYRLAYSIVTSDGANRYKLLPADPAEPDEPAPVRIFDITGTSHFRWEFHRPASGGGTILVVYGYSDLRHSGGIYRALLQHAQTLEHGLALVVQMTLTLSIKNRAEQQPGTFAPYAPLPPGRRAPSYQPLLDRGMVAFLRSQGGRLADLSLVERSRAEPARILDTAAQVAGWSSFVPTISKSQPAAGAAGGAAGGREAPGGAAVYDLEQTLPMLTFHTRYGVQREASAVDLYGLSGDLRGARLRFDARPDPKARAQIVLRGLLHYDQGSMVLRQLYKLEPLFEYGVNLGLALTLLRGVRQQAERP